MSTKTNDLVSFPLRLSSEEMAKVKILAGAELLSATNYIRKAVQVAINRPESVTVLEAAARADAKETTVTHMRGKGGKFVAKKEDKKEE